MENRATVVYAGGGTGGHLFPGLAVADCLARRRPELRQVFLTGRRATERDVLRRYAYEHLEMPAPRAPRRPWQWPSFIVRFAVAYRRCRRWSRENNVVMVVGLGGYGSVPMVWACRRRCPVVLLEQNTVPGRANRLLSRWAGVVVTAWDQTRRHFGPDVNVQHLGNPVRAGVANVGRAEARSKLGLTENRRTVLVWGGSQGAHAINQVVTDGLARIGERRDQVQFVHQTGPADETAVRQAYERAGLTAYVSAFMDAPTAYASADLFVGRAGATTLAEVCVVGLPMILVPYPYAATDHQMKNARVLEKAGAAVVIDQKELTETRFWQTVEELLGDDSRRANMTAAAKSMGRPGAADEVAELVIEGMQNEKWKNAK